MACGGRFQYLSRIVGYRMCLTDRYNVSKRCITSRKIYLSARCLKASSRNSEATDSDLDFFGLNEPSEVSQKDSQKLSKSERHYVNELVEKYSKPSHPANVQLKSFGAVRYDKKIPGEKTEPSKSQKKRERRRNRENEQNSTDISPSYSNKSGPYMLQSMKHDTVNISEPEPKEQTYPERNLSYIDEQYFSSDGLFDETPPFHEQKVKSIQIEEGKQTHKNQDTADSWQSVYRSNKTKGQLYNIKQTTSEDANKNKNDNSCASNQDLSFIDEQYFNYELDKNDTSEAHSSTISDSISSVNTKENVQNVKQTGMVKIGQSVQRIDKNDSFKAVPEKKEETFSFIDDQYFNNTHSEMMPNKKQPAHQPQSQTPLHIESDEMALKENQIKKSAAVKRRKSVERQKEKKKANHTEKETPTMQKQNANLFGKKFQEVRQGQLYSDSVGEGEWTGTRTENTKLHNQQDTVKEVPLDHKNQTAYDVSMKVRTKLEQEKAYNLVGRFDPKEYDSKGFRILRNQVPHFDNAPSIDVLSVLRKSIIYNEKDILALSKPYGLPSHNGPGWFHSVANFLDQIIPKTKLFPVHRLDKETTGVMLFAKTEEMADKLSDCFLKQEVIKKYLVITKDIPELKSGEIDIPVAEGTVEGKVRMCLRPYYSAELSAVMRKRQGGSTAITKYRVLDTGNKCAVIECYPLTGKKHQIRVHLAFGLNCPVLGDHKYSHIDRLAPMKLHPEILKRLKIQQSKVRFLAMHLHARSITIPEFFPNGRNLFILAPLPPHFIRNLKSLKMKLPQHC